MGQFYASLERGHTTASVALRRLASCTAKNRFYRANRDLGRVFKTEFLLSYLSEPPLRSRVRRGLLKVEQLHALARDVYYGRRGRINARELHEQMKSCSCLTLILACVIYWQAKEISRVVRRCKPEVDQDKLDLALLEHVSPIEWDNVILYGQYVWTARRSTDARARSPSRVHVPRRLTAGLAYIFAGIWVAAYFLRRQRRGDARPRPEHRHDHRQLLGRVAPRRATARRRAADPPRRGQRDRPGPAA